MLKTKMEEKISTEYFKRVKRLCRPKMNRGNLTRRALTPFAQFISDCELWDEQKRNCSAWVVLYQQWHCKALLALKEGGRGLGEIEDSVMEETKCLHGYQRNHIERMLQAAQMRM